MNKLILAFLFTYGVSLVVFAFGYHNVDLAFNMLNFEKKYDVKLVDESVFGVEQDAVEGYKTGIKMMFVSYILNLISVGGIVINILRTN